jgi:hypothetical protein
MLRCVAAVRAKAALETPPGVDSLAAIERLRRIPVEILEVGAALPVVAQVRRQARTRQLLLVAASAGHEDIGRIPGAPRDDVDDAVHGVGPPQRAARPGDDFDAIDVLEQVVLHVPEHPGEKR